MSTVTTPVFRASFCDLLAPKEGKNQDGSPNGVFSYSITMIFDPEAFQTPEGQKFKAAIDNVIKETWPNGAPKTGVIMPWRKGEWKTPENPRGYDLDKYPAYEGKIIATASAYTTRNPDGTFPAHEAPQLVGPNVNEEFWPTSNPKHALYSGMWGRASVRVYKPKNAQAGNRISLWLCGFQKFKDDAPLGGSGPIDVTREFSSFDVPTEEGTNSDLLGLL